MTAFTRTDTSLLGRWWWTIDHWTLAAIALLIGFGIMMTMAASPPVADRSGLRPLPLRQAATLPPADCHSRA